MRLTWVWLVVILFNSGCDYVPEGTTRFRFKADQEFDSAQITQPQGAVNAQTLRLRYADTNTFSTSETLNAGRYIFSARSYKGGYYRHEFDAETGKNLYDFPPHNPKMAVQARGPMLRGTLMGNEVPSGRMIVQFISTDVVSRPAVITPQGFEAEAPRPGNYRVQVIEPGPEPRMWISQQLDISRDLNVGAIELR